MAETKKCDRACLPVSISLFSRSLGVFPAAAAAATLANCLLADKRISARSNLPFAYRSESKGRRRKGKGELSSVLVFCFASHLAETTTISQIMLALTTAYCLLFLHLSSSRFKCVLKCKCSQLFLLFLLLPLLPLHFNQSVFAEY